MKGIYGCYSEDGALMYIGSSGISIQRLENNHRNYYKYPDGYESSFRKALATEGANWRFVWLQEPRDISKTQLEIEEGALIRYLHPAYNKDRYPYESSVRYNRLEQV